MNDLTCDLLVIGGGPGGYVCASRAARLGVDTLLVEMDRLGGTCLNVGCIPSKALIHAASSYETARRQAGEGLHGVKVAQPQLDFGQTHDWMESVTARLRGGVQGLLEHSGVKTLMGRARFLDGKTVEVRGETGVTRIRCKTVVIATGARPAELAGLPGGGKVLTSAAALSLDAVPAQLAVIGAGYIGLELGTAFAKLGSAVTLIEASGSILAQYDDKLTRPVRRRLEQLGVGLQLNTKVTGWDEADGLLHLDGPEGPLALEADRVLVTVGRTPNLDGMGLKQLQLAMSGPFLQIDDRCQTSMRGIYAIGDVTPGPMLAHRATAQAEIVADIVAGRAASWDRVCVPAVCFTDPEIAVVGLLPAEAEAQGPTVTSEFAFRGNGRALTLDDTQGFVRIVARSEDHVILGIQATGPGVSELLAGFTLAIEAGLRVDDIAGTIHPHPTLGEAVQEAALSLSSFANHKW